MLTITPVAGAVDAGRWGASARPPSDWTRGPASTDAACVWTMGAPARGDAVAVREPIIARAPGASASPLFSLTLTLARPPSLEEESIVPLIRGGTCAFTLDVAPSEKELAAAFPDEATRPDALFLRGVSFAVVRASDGARIAEASCSPFGGRAAVRSMLGADDATAFVRALRGEACGVDVFAELSYRAPHTATSPPFAFDLAAVFAFLDRRVAEDRRLFDVDLVHYFAQMLERTIIVPAQAYEDARSFAKAQLRELAGACSAILSPLRDLGGYRLVAEAPASPPVDSDTRGIPDTMRTLTLARPLHELLGPIARRYPTDALMTAVAPGGDGFAPVGARRRGTRSGRTPDLLVSLGVEEVALNLALRSGRATKPSAAALAQSGLVVRPALPAHWVLDDVIHTTTNDGVPMPVVDDPNAPLWRDRVDPKRYWYAPELALVLPTAHDSIEASSFLFSFRSTGHDANGRAGLEAAIRVRLRASMSSATVREWTALGKPNATPVALGGLAISLDVPFRDGAGRTQSHGIAAKSVVQSGSDFDVTFELVDEWARLAYGALAVADFQTRPATLTASYTFTAAVRSPRELSGGGARRVETTAGMRDRPVFPPTTTIRFPQGAGGPVQGGSPLLPRPPGTLPGTLPLRPYVSQTQGKTVTVGAHVPCAQFGSFYVEVATDGPKAIGCQDAFQLGVIDLKLFEPLALDFGVSAPFKVLRSLQVPGRFLVLPTAYTVARFEPGDARAYRPALFLFATVDSRDRDRTRCVVSATLEPAVSPYWREALRSKLEAEFHPAPELTWPADLDATPAFEWALSGAGPTAVDVDVVHTPEGFHVSLATGVDGVLLLKSMIERSGVMGSVSFPLADGTVLRSSLIVDLGHVSGPFVAGPVEIALSGGKATLTNRLDQPVDVGSLAVSNGAKRTTVPVEKRLAPAESTTVAVPTGASRPTADAAAVAEATSSLEEIRTYVEDIYVTVVFYASVDFAAAGPLSVEAMIVGVAGSVSVALSAAAPSAEMTLLLPLTTYVANPLLRYAITRSTTGATGPWRDWRLDALGSVIEIKNTELP